MQIQRISGISNTRNIPNNKQLNNASNIKLNNSTDSVNFCAIPKQPMLPETKKMLGSVSQVYKSKSIQLKELLKAFNEASLAKSTDKIQIVANLNSVSQKLKVATKDGASIEFTDMGSNAYWLEVNKKNGSEKDLTMFRLDDSNILSVTRLNGVFGSTDDISTPRANEKINNELQGYLREFLPNVV